MVLGKEMVDLWGEDGDLKWRWGNDNGNGDCDGVLFVE